MTTKGHPNSEDEDKESILIVDTAADQCTCGGPAWTVLHDTGDKIQCNGYLKGNGANEGPVLPLVSAITCVDVEGEDPYLFLLNQAWYYEHSEQNESLIHPYQAMDHGVKFCLTPKSRLTPEGEVGKQMMTVDEQKYHFSMMEGNYSSKSGNLQKMK